MTSVYNYTDYRKFLSDSFAERKETDFYFSFRYISSKTGVDASFLAKVLNGKMHLAAKHFQIVAKLFGLSERETEYFELMAAFNKSKSEDKSRSIFEKMLNFRSIKANTLLSGQYEYYKKWYYSAVRAYVGMGKLSTKKNDVKTMATCLVPSISIKEAKDAIELLLKLELIKVEDEQYLITDQFITPSSDWGVLAIRSYQNETIDLAKNSLKTVDKSLRDISTLTLGISQDDIPELRERLREFRQSVQRFTENTENANSVYQLNLQLFPMVLLEENK